MASHYETLKEQPTVHADELLSRLKLITRAQKIATEVRLLATILLTRDHNLYKIKVSDIVSTTNDHSSPNYIDTQEHIWYVNGKCYDIPDTLIEIAKQNLDKYNTVCQDYTPMNRDTVAKTLNNAFKKAAEVTYAQAIQILTGKDNGDQ